MKMQSFLHTKILESTHYAVSLTKLSRSSLSPLSLLQSFKSEKESLRFLKQRQLQKMEVRVCVLIKQSEIERWGINIRILCADF